MEEFDLKKLMSDMQGGKNMPEKDNKMKKKNEITEDDVKDLEKDMQKVTDDHIKQIDKILADKEKEIMQV